MSTYFVKVKSQAVVITIENVRNVSFDDNGVASFWNMAGNFILAFSPMEWCWVERQEAK